MMLLSVKAQSQYCDTIGLCNGIGQDYIVGSNVSTNAGALSTSGLPGYLNDAKILVCGSFTIDNNFNLFNSTVILSEDSELIVEGANRFLSSNSHFQGCNGMWKGITVEENGIMYARSSFFLDAYIAGITAKEGSIVRLISNNFSRNHISVAAVDGSVDLLLIGNNFYDHAFILNYPPGGGGNNGGKPWIAIDVQNASVNIGDARYASLKNLIDGEFIYGIRLNNAQSKIENNTFKDLAQLSGSDATGTAIYLSNRSVATIQHNEFENVFYGIDSKDWSNRIEVKENDFAEYNFGIAGNFIGPAKSFIFGNQIGNSSESGPFGVQLHQIGSVLITRNNTIHADSRDGIGALLSGKGAIGIWHYGFLSGNSEIINNHITLHHHSDRPYRNGIRLENLSGTEVFNNSIYIESEGAPFHGIETRNADYTRIEDNVIKADERSYNIGLKIMDSDHVKYCCNLDSAMDIGVLILENCDGSDFSTHNFFGSNTGLQINEGAILGRQYLTGNRWWNYFANWGALNLNADPLYIRGSKFYVNEITKPKGPGTVSPASNWFAVDNTIDDKPCGALDDFECGEGPPHTPGITDYDTLFAGGYLDTVLGSGSRWISAQNLYSKMEAYSTLYGTYDITDDWYDNHSSGIVGDYYKVHDSIQRMFVIPEISLDSLDNCMDSIRHYNQQLAHIDSLIEADTITNWSAYDATRELIVQNLDSTYAVYLRCYTNIINARKTWAQQLSNTNALLSTPDLASRSEKEFNKIFLNTIAMDVDNFTAAQKDSLYTIAMRCPREAGRAVYWAASLYQLIEDEYFDIEGNCSMQQAIASGTNEHPSNVRSLSITPSPAMDYIQISTSAGDPVPGLDVLRIFDLSGAEIWNGRVNAGNRIDISRIPPGMYVVLANAEGVMYRTKLIIQR